MTAFVDFLNTQYYKKFQQEISIKFTIDADFLKEYRSQQFSKKTPKSLSSKL